jgi:hypothetical protein
MQQHHQQTFTMDKKELEELASLKRGSQKIAVSVRDNCTTKN